MGLRLSPKRFIAAVSAILACYSLARVAVLFFEALAVVREGRAEDYELLDICQRGDARGSAKMREACLRARADLASPVVFKAIVHAVSTAFKDFSDAVGSPFKLLVVVLFIISSVMMPIVPWCRAFFGQPVHDPAPFNGVHYISYAPAPYAHQPRGRFRNKMSKMLRLRGRPTIEEFGDADEDEEGQFVGQGMDAMGVMGKDTHWMDIDLARAGGGVRPASPNGHSKWE